MAKVRITLSVNADVVADLQAIVGNLKAKAVRRGGRPEGTNISTFCEQAIKREIKRQTKT